MSVQRMDIVIKRGMRGDGVCGPVEIGCEVPASSTYGSVPESPPPARYGTVGVADLRLHTLPHTRFEIFHCTEVVCNCCHERVRRFRPEKFTTHAI